MNFNKLFDYISHHDDGLKNSYPSKTESRIRFYFHCSSVGEFLLISPFAEDFTKLGHEVVITFTSKSLKDWLAKNPLSYQVLFIGYIPIPMSFYVKKWLDKINPDCVIFCKYDLFGSLVFESYKRSIPLIGINITISESSSRYNNRYLRNKLKNILEKFLLIYPNSQRDRDLLERISPNLKLKKTQDITFDMVKRRLSKGSDISLKHNPNTLIIGSLREEDSSVALAGAKILLEKNTIQRVIIVPHEISSSVLDKIEDYFKGQSVSRFSEIKTFWNVLIVDSIGKLNQFYKFSDLVFMGGGFATGVHNVVEPIAFGLPTFFGPNYKKSSVALQLINLNLAESISSIEQFEFVADKYLREKETLSINLDAFYKSKEGALEDIKAKILSYF